MPLDTTADAHEQWTRIWSGLAPAERAKTLLERAAMAREMRRAMLRRQHPGLSDAEINALWLEQTYRGTVPDALLDDALRHIRAAG